MVTGNGRSTAGVEQLGEVRRHCSMRLRPGLEEVEGAVAHTGVLLGDLAGVADVGLTHLQEHPTGGDQSQ